MPTTPLNSLKGVILDAASLGEGVNFAPLEQQLADFVRWDSTGPDQTLTRIQGAHVVFTNKVVIDAAMMRAADNLKLICVLATGTNNVDIAAAEALGIEVRNVNAYGTASVAQHTLTLMLALATRLVPYQRSVQQGEWQRASMFCLMHHPVMQLSGKTLVLVGHGELGQEVERLALAFGMHVKVAARPGKTDDTRPSLDTLLPEADVVSLHCPLTPDTQHLINQDNLALCKPTALLVNCARGGIIHEQDALNALRQGLIGGLAVDVLTQEPPRDGNVLLDALHEGLNLIVTPHSAWLAPEARQRIIELSGKNVADWKNP